METSHAQAWCLMILTLAVRTARSREWVLERDAATHSLFLHDRNSHFWKVHVMGADTNRDAFPRSGWIRWSGLLVLRRPKCELRS